MNRWMINMCVNIFLKNKTLKLLYVGVMTETFNDLKIKILKKKILGNFIIESYANIDRLYRYVHMGFAISAPLISLIDFAVTGEGNATFSASLILSAVVAGMVKIKDHMKFDKIRDIAKHQNLRYEKLYKHIETESIKQQTPEREFIYWINRAYIDIEQMDPELPTKDKAKFLKFLADNNIKWDFDTDKLSDLQQMHQIQNIEPSNQPSTQPLGQSLGYPLRQITALNNTFESNQPLGQPLGQTFSQTLSQQPSQITALNSTFEPSQTLSIDTYNTTDDIKIAIDRLNSLNV
jgi:hypothetical protein